MTHIIDLHYYSTFQFEDTIQIHSNYLVFCVLTDHILASLSVSTEVVSKPMDQPAPGFKFS